MATRLAMYCRRTLKVLLGRHRMVKSFDDEICAGIARRIELGIQPVPTEKVIGSVGRAQNLRSDFFYRTGRTITARFLRVGEAMREGKELPPVELYKVRRDQNGPSGSPESEYYVLDGHHRIAMARKLGQAYIDATVVEYRVADVAVPGTSPDKAGESSEPA